MCGIAGTQGEFPQRVTAAITRALAHRGPDGDGLSSFVEPSGKSTHLGHRRLAIIDVSEAGAQPMHALGSCCRSAADGHITIVYNGEIYNFVELRASLESEGHLFHSRSDTEVLLHGYAEWGLSLFDRINGIFALAIRDGRIDGRPTEVGLGDLVLARDHLGVKPLYVATTAQGFLFSSELRPLLPYVSPTVNPDAVVDFLQYLWVPSPRTIVREVTKVEPGSALIVHEGSIVRQWSYYSLPYGSAPTSSETYEAAKGTLHAKLVNAVRRQMVADVPVGAFLSGGVDSSTIAALMCTSGQPQSFYTIRFSDADASMDGAEHDLPYARAVADYLHCPLTEVEVRPEQLLAIDELVRALDEPHADPAPANALLIARAAKEAGISVLLSGAGGDDLFTGYRRHWTLSVSQRLAKVPRPLLQVMGGCLGLCARLPSPMRSFARRVQGVVDRALLSVDQRVVGLFQWTTLATIEGLLAPAISNSATLGSRNDLLAQSLRNIPTGATPLQRMLFLEGRYFLSDHNLMYTDKMGMAEGVEIRVPLIDRELVDFAIGLPDNFKLRGNEGKAILKAAMEGYVPPEVLTRSKTGFGVPLRDWMRTDLKPVVDRVLSLDRLRQRGLFDAGKVRQLIETDRQGTGEHAYLVYALLSLEVWLSQLPMVTVSHKSTGGHAMRAVQGLASVSTSS